MADQCGFDFQLTDTYFKASTQKISTKSVASELPDGEPWFAKVLMGTVVYALVWATAGVVNAIQVLFETMSIEFNLYTSVEELTLWEKSVSLPDSRINPGPQTICERRIAIKQRLKKEATVTLQEMQDLIDEAFPGYGIYLDADRIGGAFRYTFRYTFQHARGSRDRFVINVNIPWIAIDPLDLENSPLTWENLQSWLRDFVPSPVLLNPIYLEQASYCAITNPRNTSTIYNNTPHPFFGFISSSSSIQMSTTSFMGSYIWTVKFKAENLDSLDNGSIYHEYGGDGDYIISKGTDASKSIRVYINHTLYGVIADVQFTMAVFANGWSDIEISRVGDSYTLTSRGTSEAIVNGLSVASPALPNIQIGRNVDSFDGNIRDFELNGIVVPVNEGSGTDIKDVNGASVGVLSDVSSNFWVTNDAISEIDVHWKEIDIDGTVVNHKDSETILPTTTEITRSFTDSTASLIEDTNAVKTITLL